ncbi:SMI1/KNR4 family protein [Paenibacillus daejeonensis]|uniref:SMI1/KNR4 family protein n=1 Tax=Paenibacillus daejeonensis TaxID=135193 RepID=UPI000368FDB7|nr:SMI1/KNR4 family protein [Paenibacillus daejeonensis]
MTNKRDTFFNWAKENGWTIIENKQSVLHLNEGFRARYKDIPTSYVEFLRTVKQCVAPDELTWFLCEDDYNGRSDSEFTWDAFEQLSLEAAMDDTIWRAEITAWWDQHLPIMMSVDGGYSFYAIELATGAIVRGSEPEFEEVDVVAHRLDDFYTYLQRT